MMALSKREQRVALLVGGLALLILWLYTAYIVAPLLREGASLGEQVRTARGELTALTNATANEAVLRNQYRQLEQSVRSLRSLLPAEEELPASIEFLSDLARQTSVKIQAIFPQREEAASDTTAPAAPAAQPATYKEVPIQIDALSGYHQLGLFLSLVETASKPMHVTSLRISTNPKEPRWHTVRLVIGSYFAAKEAAPGAASAASPPSSAAPKP